VSIVEHGVAIFDCDVAVAKISMVAHGPVVYGPVFLFVTLIWSVKLYFGLVDFAIVG
jgi:hypothetical protein